MAGYDNILSPLKGVIIATNNFGPAYQLQQSRAYQDFPGTNVVNRVPDDQLPPQLSQWSDVMYLEWMKHANFATRRNLKYVIRMGVANYLTRAIVARALTQEYYNAAPGPQRWANRAVISLDADAGKAILGSPNGQGVGWFLAQHQGSRQLGKKTISKVAIFDQSAVLSDAPLDIDLWEVHLLFYVTSA